MKRPDFDSLPLAPSSVWRGIFNERCQECGSYAITARKDKDEIVIACKDCFRAVSHPNPRIAFEYFCRPLMSEEKLDKASFKAAAKVILASAKGN